MDTKIKEDGYSLHMLSTQGIYIEPLWLKEFRERMRQIQKDFEDEMASIDRGEIPTKYGFEVWNMMRKDKEKMMNKQSKKKSFIESLVNTFVGMVITFIISPFVYWICDVEVNVGQISSLTILFTIVSILRNYIIRRWFNKLK